MPRFDPRLLVVVPVLLAAAACGSDEPAAPAPLPSPPVVTASPGADDSPVPEPSESVYVEQEPDPTDTPGDMNAEAQSALDEALGLELGALEGAPPATAAAKRKTLDKLPEDPGAVLKALQTYEWFTPAAKAKYDQAVKATQK